MLKIINIINKLSKSQKIICLILLLGLVLFASVGIPTLARYINRVTINNASVWDGSTASSYKSGTGTEADPYIISNGSELAYFYTRLSSNNYENTYFALSNDIVLNNGIFNYDSDNGIQYISGSQTFYIDDYTNKYYDNVDRTGTEIGTINAFNPLDGFKGHFNGKYYTIYGLYLTDENSSELALFTNLQGDVHNLYVENSVVYGGSFTAGIASDATNSSLSNILFDGYVVGKNTSRNISTIPTASVINIQNIETTNYINLTSNIPLNSEIVSTSITGNYVIDGATETDTLIKINGNTVTGGSFNIDLGNSILNTIPVLTSTTSSNNPTLTFSNLSYNIVYKYAISGGIVAIGNNTTIENTINKGYVYGYSVSGGLIGYTNSLTNINQSYNLGNINSQYVSGGLVGKIENSTNDIIISKSYNTGDMSASNIGGLIGVIDNNSGTISISNVFNTSTTNYSIGTINNTTVNVSNAYYAYGTDAVNSGVIHGSFELASMVDLNTKNYVVSNLSYNEFVSFNDLETNTQNVWVYEKDSLPMLFIDDITNPIANIHASVYTWNNLSHDLNTLKLNSNITFNIEQTDILRPLKEVYYYISNDTDALTNEEISAITSWTPYSSIVQITEEGNYVIYAKIVDYDDNVTYLNTDVLMLDLPGVSANIKIDDNTWSNLRFDLNYVYIDRPKTLTVEPIDPLLTITSIKYYIADGILNTNELNELSSDTWTTYSEGALINESGKHIVYIKITDNSNYNTYINTDYIVLDGYNETDLIIGRNSASYFGADPYITNKSTASLNVSYSNTSTIDLSDYTHNLMSNILLPIGAKITLIDNVMNKVYEYKITTDTDIYNYNNSCDVNDLDCIKKATYPFTLFKEIGTSATDKNYVESSYYNNGTINENFTIVLDLSSTNIVTNYDNVALYIELHDSNSNNIRPTLYSSIKQFNIYSNVNSEDTKSSLYLTTDYSGNGIVFNSNSSTDINITSGLTYKYINSFKITDTTYEDKDIGISIKLVDSNGVIVNKDDFKNIIFKVGTDTYYPEKDNIVRINLNTGIADVTKTLTIITYENNGNLAEGTYYFRISNYASYDGYYYSDLGNTELSIPVIVSNNNSNIAYSFDVVMDDANRVISKTNDVVKVSFNILQNGTLDDPNIRVSLYKKDQLTAYDQSYSIVDLKDYVSDDLDIYAGNIYYVSTDPVQYNGSENSYNAFELSLITANFENIGYKFVFDLYDGTKKIGAIEKHFIVK